MPRVLRWMGGDAMKPISEAARRVLGRAAKRERGNICPIVDVRIFAAAETTLIRSLVLKGLVDEEGIPYITDAGRDAVAAMPWCDRCKCYHHDTADHIL